MRAKRSKAKRNWQSIARVLNSGVEIQAVMESGGSRVYRANANDREVRIQMSDATVDAMPYGNAERTPIIVELYSAMQKHKYMVYDGKGGFIARFECQKAAVKRAKDVEARHPVSKASVDRRIEAFKKRGALKKQRQEELRAEVAAAREQRAKTVYRKQVEERKEEIRAQRRREARYESLGEVFGSW